MRAWVRRLRQGRASSLEAELTAARAQPPAGLVDSIVAMVRPRRSARPTGFRLGFAGGLTAAMVAVLAATGGLAYAATAISQASHSLHPTVRPAPHRLGTRISPAVTSACSQYAVAPVVSGIAPSSGEVGTSVTITGSHFSGNSAVTSVTFGGGASASFSVGSDSSLTATVPAGAQTGAVTVANCKGSASTGTFTVTVPPKPKPKPKPKPRACVVPNVKGDSVGAARSAITHHHCKPGKITKVKSSKKNKNKVISQSEKPGKHLKNGFHINLTVGK